MIMINYKLDKFKIKESYFKYNMKTHTHTIKNLIIEIYQKHIRYTINKT